MAESFLTKVANDVLEASEKLSTRLEEGITALVTGELPQAAAREPTSSSSIPSSSEEDMVGEFGEEEEGSPLLGIAESVIGDIMDQQVCVD